MLYKTLTMLLNETDKETFSSLLAQFKKYWVSKEPEFIHYFDQYYAARSGQNDLKSAYKAN